MTDTELLAAVKPYLRISTNSVDTELLQTMHSCLIDLRTSGVSNIDTNNPLVMQAIKEYCKGNFGFDTEAERHQQAYERIKIKMNLSSEFNETYLTDEEGED